MEDRHAKASVQRRALEYIEQAREAFHPPVEEVRPPLDVRVYYWVIGALCVLILGALEEGVILNRDGTTGLPQPPPITAAYESDPCTQRQNLIVRAITDYIHQHGQPPSNLALLGPPQLTVAAVEPYSGHPYVYTLQGNGFLLSCPDPDQHPLRRNW